MLLTKLHALRRNSPAGLAKIKLFPTSISCFPWTGRRPKHQSNTAGRSEFAMESIQTMKKPRHFVPSEGLHIASLVFGKNVLAKRLRGVVAFETPVRLGKIKHFTGNIWWMAPLMLPIHIVGELSRPISMTLRLFGNIMGEDVVILVLTVALFPLLVPLPMYMMAIFTSLLQALVFTILTGVYLSGALSEGH